MRNLILLCLLSLFAFAQTLQLKEGKIQAHTEVFGDSTIDPYTTHIEAQLMMQNHLETLKGKLSIQALSLISDNKDRDKHMYEVLNVHNAPSILFDINEIIKENDNYRIYGILTLNGVPKEIDSLAKINQSQNSIELDGDFSIKLTDFNLEPPTLLFLTVRNQIDVHYHLNLIK